MMDLSFLKNVEVKEVAIKAKVDRVKLDKFPMKGSQFRVYKNGRIFTAEQTAVEFSLEFSAKEEIIIPGKDTDEDKTKEIVTGNGLDIFSSENWQMIATPEPMLFVAVVPRNGNAKIDVYGSCTYEDDGAPKRSITNNTVSTFGKEYLVPQLEELYGIDFEAVDYVDLVMNTEYAIEAPRGVFSIPKTVSRGDNKGDLVFITRKNITVFPLTVFEAPIETDKQVDLEESIEEVQAEADVNKSEEVIYEEPSIDNNFSSDTIAK
jgi:hypothetical protein